MEHEYLDIARVILSRAIQFAYWTVHSRFTAPRVICALVILNLQDRNRVVLRKFNVKTR